MLKNRKAQGMSIKIIIVAIIALIVLIAVGVMFSGKFGDFRGGLKSVGDPSKTCESQEGGQPQKNDCGAKEISILFRDAGAKGMKCCVLTSAGREREDCCDGCEMEKGVCEDECRNPRHGDPSSDCIVICETKYKNCVGDCNGGC